MMLGLFAAAAGMMVALIGDILASRAGATRVNAYAVSFLAGLCATLATIFLFSQPLQPHLLGIAILAYGTWWFAFLNLVQALASSLRIRLLMEIRAAGGRISRTALRLRYNDETLLSLRLHRLLSHGAIVEVDGCLHVASRSLTFIALFFRTLKKALTGRGSEFAA